MLSESRWEKKRRVDFVRWNVLREKFLSHPRWIIDENFIGMPFLIVDRCDFPAPFRRKFSLFEIRRRKLSDQQFETIVFDEQRQMVTIFHWTKRRNVAFLSFSMNFLLDRLFSSDKQKICSFSSRFSWESFIENRTRKSLLNSAENFSFSTKNGSLRSSNFPSSRKNSRKFTSETKRKKNRKFVRNRERKSFSTNGIDRFDTKRRARSSRVRVACRSSRLNKFHRKFRDASFRKCACDQNRRITLLLADLCEKNSSIYCTKISFKTENLELIVSERFDIEKKNSAVRTAIQITLW